MANTKLVVGTILLVVASGSVDAGGISSAARTAFARQVAPAAIPGKPHDVIVFRSRHPQAAAHIEKAQRTGQPTVLHIDRARAAERRAAAIGTVNRTRKPSPGYDRDEYPFAFTREGGHNASVRFIDPRDNRGSGSSIGAQTRGLPEGSKIRVLVAD